MMKRFYSLILTALFVCAFMLSALAESTPVLSINEAAASAGDEVTLTIEMKNSPGVAGMQFSLDYDSSALSFVSGKIDSAFSFSSPVNADRKPVVFALVTGFGTDKETGKRVLTELTGDLTVATVTFKVLEEAKAGKYDVTIILKEVLDSEIQKLEATCINGSITVEDEKAETTSPSTGTTKPSAGTSIKPSKAEDETSNIKFTATRTYRDSFTDVTAEHWFYSFVKNAYEYELVNGTSETKFSPDNSFTAAQAITVAANIHVAYSGKTVREAKAGEKWYDPYVEYCVENCIITEDQFAAYDDDITRGDMAVIFANILPDSEYTAFHSGAPSDVAAESSAYSSVKKLYEAGIIRGDAGTGNYRPDDSIKRSEACVIFTRIAMPDQRAK